MKSAPIGVALLAGVALTGCAADKTAVLREAAITQIERLEASGLNYVELPPERRAQISSACAIATTVITVWNPNVPDAPSTVEDFCTTFLRAAE